MCYALTREGVVVGEDGGLGVSLVGRHGVVLVDDGDDALCFLFGWLVGRGMCVSRSSLACVFPLECVM